MTSISTTTTDDPTREVLALGLGSNLGEREANLRQGVRELARHLGPLRVASIYESPALLPPGGEPQPDYLNTVVLGTAAPDGTVFDRPEELLTRIRELEAAAGRRPGPRWAARTLDVDFLLLGKRCCRSPDLILPHPELRRRRFVLAPLAELSPDLRLPPDGARVTDLLAGLGDDHPITRREWRRPP